MRAAGKVGTSLLSCKNLIELTGEMRAFDSSYDYDGHRYYLSH